MLWIVATNAAFRAYCSNEGLDPDDRSIVRRVNTIVVAQGVYPNQGDEIIHIADPKSGDGNHQVYNYLFQKAVIS